MGVLNDVTIEQLAITHDMIVPFAVGEKRPGEISYGLSSYGYDFRVGGEFEVFADAPEARMPIPYGGPDTLDPKNFNPGKSAHQTFAQGEPFYMPPYSFALGVSLERFKIPRDIITLCLGKSTYARCGLYVNITPFEPEWQGHATVELTNPTPRRIAVYPFEGVAQLVFLQAGYDMQYLCEELSRMTDFQNDPWSGRLICRTSYADKDGKYNNQEGRIVHPKVDR